jgi:hypothetical protein
MWAVKRSLGIQKEVAKMLNLSIGADMYEIAGCMLRLAMWPTTKLWQALDESLVDQLHTLIPPTQVSLSSKQPLQIAKQIGFHFRCGDTSFSKTTNKPNPECYADPTGITPWKGTNFGDDQAQDSPLDEAMCGKKILLEQSRVYSKNNVLAYIASDNPHSSRQINDSLQWPFVIKPPQGCHIDLQKSLQCTLTTSIHWFMLSLSDYIVMQALIKPQSSPYQNSPETAYMPDSELAPVSAFSRYAALYSLSPQSGILYGKGCVVVNTTQLSIQTHGNWVCDPKMFF